jgi:hypothetical protein
MRIAPALACLPLLAAPAWAARPMITDDARIVDAKACQVESWVRTNAASRESWALPACNPTGGAELTFGGARTRVDGEAAATTDIQAQAKTLFRPLVTNGWGYGLAVGTVRHPNLAGGGRFPGDLYAYVPASVSFADDAVVAHANVGALRRKEDGQRFLTWGLAAETRLDARLQLVTEAFGQQVGNPFFQLGLRFWLVPDRLQVDATYGNRFGSTDENRWYSIGLRLLTPPFLP